MSKEKLLAKLASGLATQLTNNEQMEIKQLLRPLLQKGFSGEQQSLMEDWFLELPPNRLPELEALNAQHTSVAVGVQLKNGDYILPISLLTDCDRGETFEHLQNFLLSLKHRKVDKEMFVVVPPFAPNSSSPEENLKAPRA